MPSFFEARKEEVSRNLIGLLLNVVGIILGGVSLFFGLSRPSANAATSGDFLLALAFILLASTLAASVSRFVFQRSIVVSFGLSAILAIIVCVIAFLISPAAAIEGVREDTLLPDSQGLNLIIMSTSFIFFISIFDPILNRTKEWSDGWSDAENVIGAFVGWTFGGFAWFLIVGLCFQTIVELITL